jgi:hypothetical protein
MQQLFVKIIFCNIFDRFEISIKFSFFYSWVFIILFKVTIALFAKLEAQCTWKTQQIKIFVINVIFRFRIRTIKMLKSLHNNFLIPNSPQLTPVDTHTEQDKDIFWRSFSVNNLFLFSLSCVGGCVLFGNDWQLYLCTVEDKESPK